MSGYYGVQKTIDDLRAALTTAEAEVARLTAIKAAAEQWCDARRNCVSNEFKTWEDLANAEARLAGLARQ